MKRTPIKRKAKHAKITKSGRVILDAKGMKALGEAVFERAGGQCENYVNHRYADFGLMRCVFGPQELHHIVYRSHGGSDSELNTAAICLHCHHEIHAGKIKFTRP